jgi:excisionase family DNA binding protein
VSELTLTVPDELVERIAERVAAHIQAREDEKSLSPWLDVNAACTYLGFTKNTLYRLTAARAIPCRKKTAGQGLRFHRDELDQWMNEHYPRLDHHPH